MAQRSTEEEKGVSPGELAAYAKEQGNLAFKQGDYRKAITYYNGAVFNEPTNHVHYSNRCAAYMKCEQYSLAQQDAEKCLQLKPDFNKVSVSFALEMCVFIVFPLPGLLASWYNFTCERSIYGGV